MAVNKKPLPKPPLSMVEIVMRADAATIQAALEARQKVDALLAERAAAYERIAALEQQIDNVVGEPGVFVFPPPPKSVAQFSFPSTVTAPASPAAVKPATASTPAEENSAISEQAPKPSHAAEIPSRKGAKN
ncbi:MAG: hypothetical protein II943_04445 [Victivallales bacterium]|nr:hypothetical protein [Victivallales bacterium]